MIARVDPKHLKAAAELVSAGISSDMQSSWLRLQANKETGSLYLQVAGVTEYQAVIPAKLVFDGVVYVHSKTFVELVAKLKNEFLKTPCSLNCSEGKYLTLTNGSATGYRYNLPLNLIEQPSSFNGPELASFELNSSQLLDVIAGLKAMRESESDSDVPACEIICMGQGDLQFVSYTRNRSVSSWVECKNSVMYPTGAMKLFIAIDHLRMMEKAFKVAGKELKKGESPIPVEMRVWSNSIRFGFCGGGMDSCYITLRRIQKEASNINNLIGICKRPEMIRASMLVEGDKLKQAYDRLDAFGKRNEQSQHKIEFRLVAGEMQMQAGGQGVGFGREVLPVNFLKSPTELPLHFAAAGNKLADLLRISKFGQVKMSVGQRNILLEWDNHELGIKNLAMLAGMAVGVRDED